MRIAVPEFHKERKVFSCNELCRSVIDKGRKVGAEKSRVAASLTELKPGRDPDHLQTVPVTFLPKSAEFLFPESEILVSMYTRFGFTARYSRYVHSFQDFSCLLEHTKDLPDPTVFNLAEMVISFTRSQLSESHADDDIRDDKATATLSARDIALYLWPGSRSC